MIRKGNFDIKHFKENDTEIKMDRWISPVLINTGGVTISLRGIEILPGDSFQMGADNLEISQIENIQFTGSQTGVTKKYAVAYNTAIQEKCN